MSNDDPAGPTRRRVLEVAACGLAGGVAVAVGVPVLGHLASPVGRRTVVRADAPIDVGALEALQVGAPPVRVAVVAPVVRDAWSARRDVPLGAAWLARVRGDEVRALSSVCPHLGCAVGWDAARERFLCPCHDSAFSPDGARLFGPSPRDLDPLPIVVEGGRLRLTWIAYRQGQAARVAV